MIFLMICFTIERNTILPISILKFPSRFCIYGAAAISNSYICPLLPFLQVDELLEKEVDVTIYNGQVRSDMPFLLNFMS